MIDLTRQIEAYAEQLDLTVAPPEELLERRRLAKPPVATRSRGWVAAAAAAAGAAAVVLVAVGVVAINRGDNVVTNTPSTTQATANTTTTNAPTVLRFESATETPAFDTGGPEEWDSPYVSPGAVIYQDGIYHMLRNGFGDEKPTGVGYGVSDNGVLWGEVGAEPVFSLEGGQVHTGLVASDGNWIVYFDSQLYKDDEETRYRTIGRASAPGPEGPWVVDSDPVLVPGAAGAWDQSLVQQPSVIETSNGFVMYYTGAGKDGYAIGRATSSDGIEWVKDDQPVLTPDSEWEGSELTRPDVVVTEDGLVMMYGNRSGSHRGIATSRDGLTWTRFSGNPVLDTRAVPRATMMTGELFYRDGVYLLYLENGGTFSTTNIAVLTRDAPIQIR